MCGCVRHFSAARLQAERKAKEAEEAAAAVKAAEEAAEAVRVAEQAAAAARRARATGAGASTMTVRRAAKLATRHRASTADRKSVV